MLFDKVFILVCCILFHVNGEESQCTSDTTQLLELKYVNASTSAEMLLSWGISSIGDIGNYDHCQSQIAAHMCVCNWGTLGNGIGLFQGYCLPDSCHGDGNMPDFEISVLNESINLNTQMCSCGDTGKSSWSPGAVFMLLLTIALAIINIYATYMSYIFEYPEAGLFSDVNTPASVPLEPTAGEGSESLLRGGTVEGKERDQNQTWDSSLAVFDMRKNMATLLNRDPKRKYQALDGLRAFSMFWIIMGHTGDFATRIGFSNWQDVYVNIFTTFGTNFFVISANFAVDTFFYLSGFLSTHILIRKMEKAKGRVPLALAVVARWFRLVPVYAFVIFFGSLVVPNFGDGPFWFMYEDEILTTCQTNWWTHLAFINNFIPHDYTEQCLPWTWYLANDFQFFIIGTILVKVHYHSRRSASVLAVSILSTCVVIVMYLSYQHNLNFYSPDQQNMIYDKPYTRAQTYMIGVLAGFFLNSQWGNYIPSLKVANGLTLAALVVMFFSSSALYWFFQCPDGGCWGPMQVAWYNGFGRIGWTLSLAVLTHLCNNLDIPGLIRPIRGILSLSVWDPVAKLTYGAYLIHPIVMRVLYYQTRQVFYFSWWWLAYEHAAMATLSYMIAVLLFICIEQPFGTILGTVFAKFSKSKSSQDKSLSNNKTTIVKNLYHNDQDEEARSARLLTLENEEGAHQRDTYVSLHDQQLDIGVSVPKKSASMLSHASLNN